MPKKFIAYTRVSTQKQGTQGVSLEEQHRAIIGYAQCHSLIIGDWFTERCSAAKNGRPVFQLVMKELISGGDQLGLMMHKIDRGARNLKDWAMIGELIDQGVDVRFVRDNLDLSSRGGRLTADLQAVIAADYIRNLRDEVKKGIDGRVNQGLYPFKAPRGYLDRGRGRAKVPDPQEAPLVVAAFNLYAEATYSLHSLAADLHLRGLATGQGQPLSPNSLSRMLRNPFYLGQIIVKGRQAQGRHQPLVSPELFSRVQTVCRNVDRHAVTSTCSATADSCGAPVASAVSSARSRSNTSTTGAVDARVFAYGKIAWWTQIHGFRYYSGRRRETNLY